MASSAGKPEDELKSTPPERLVDQPRNVHLKMRQRHLILLYKLS